MQTQISIGYEQIRNLAFLLPKQEKKKLIMDLHKLVEPQKDRVFGEYDGQGWMSDDFMSRWKNLQNICHEILN